MKKIYMIIGIMTFAISMFMPNRFPETSNYDEISKLFLYGAFPEEQGYAAKMNELQENGDFEAMNDLMNEVISKQANVDSDIHTYEILKKQKTVKEAPGADTVAIRVNEYEITKGDVGVLKVNAENRVNVDVLQINLQDEIKREIINEVRTRIVSAEAKSRGYKPTQEEVDGFFETQKKFQEEWLARLKNKGYESVYDMTDEYWKSVYESGYLMFQRSMLYDSVIEDNLEEINNEATERKIPIDDIKEEYWQRFIDELVSQTKIEIVDPEIKALFGIEE